MSELKHSKVCTKCNLERAIERFGLSRGKHRSACKDCRNAAYPSKNYASSRDEAKYRARRDRSNAKRKAAERWMQPGEREKRAARKHQWRVNKAAAEGRVLKAPNNALPPTQRWERDQSKLAVQNAAQAWRWWLDRAPDWWVRAYYRAAGKPWSNPRLDDASQWRIRYWLDPVFRAKEIEKVQTLKARRSSEIAATDDGSLTGAVIVSLYAAARCCPYCTKAMRSVEKSLDHKLPLSRGGAHSIANVVVCCKECNTLKGTRTIDEWIAALMVRKPLIEKVAGPSSASTIAGAAAA